MVVAIEFDNNDSLVIKWGGSNLYLQNDQIKLNVPYPGFFFFFLAVFELYNIIIEFSI